MAPIEAFILTGVTNAASEGINRQIKLEARNAFGFRTPPTNASDHAAQASARPLRHQFGLTVVWWCGQMGWSHRGAS